MDWNTGLDYWTAQYDGFRDRDWAGGVHAHVHLADLLIPCGVRAVEPEEMDVTASTWPEGNAERPIVIYDDHLVPVLILSLRMQCSS